MASLLFFRQLLDGVLFQWTEYYRTDSQVENVNIGQTDYRSVTFIQCPGDWPLL